MHSNFNWQRHEAFFVTQYTIVDLYKINESDIEPMERRERARHGEWLAVARSKVYIFD